jgi:hypothetical protein
LSLTPAQVIVFATPVFLGLIAIEFAVGWARGRNTYRLADAFNSIGLGMMSQVTGLFTKLAAIGIYTLGLQHARLCRCRARRCGSGSSACCSTTSATTGCTASATRGAVLGRAFGAPPERGLQPVDRAAPDLQRLDRRLDLLPADGLLGFRRWCSAWSR